MRLSFRLSDTLDLPDSESVGSCSSSSRSSYAEDAQSMRCCERSTAVQPVAHLFCRRRQNPHRPAGWCTSERPCHGLRIKRLDLMDPPPTRSMLPEPPPCAIKKMPFAEKHVSPEMWLVYTAPSSKTNSQRAAMQDRNVLFGRTVCLKDAGLQGEDCFHPPLDAIGRTSGDFPQDLHTACGHHLAFTAAVCDAAPPPSPNHNPPLLCQRGGREASFAYSSDNPALNRSSKILATTVSSPVPQAFMPFAHATSQSLSATNEARQSGRTPHHAQDSIGVVHHCPVRVLNHRPRHSCRPPHGRCTTPPLLRPGEACRPEVLPPVAIGQDL